MARRKRTASTSPTAPPRQYVVRFGLLRTLGVMNSATAFRYGDEVVARTPRGTELGTVLCEATPAAIDAMESEPTAGDILRSVTKHDAIQSRHLQSMASSDRDVVQQCIDQAALTMELVDVERLLGGEKIIVYFVADGRVDFRHLVALLRTRLRHLIEMRQIGVRQEAKVLADYGDCGRPICCATFLTKMPPVSMRMARLQKATLDPTKISGRCGRLKCCLRYEFDTYAKAERDLPAPGSIVLTRHGNATVLDRDLLAGQLAVKTDDQRRILIGGDEVVRIVKRAEPPPPPPAASPD